MKKQTDWTTIILVGIIILLAVGIKQGWINRTVYTNVTNQETLNKLDSDQLESQCVITLSPSTITAGDLVTASISDGANTVCEIFAKSNLVPWIKIGELKTESDGKKEINSVFNYTGTFQFRAICGDCVTNIVNLKSNPSSPCVDSDGRDRYAVGHVTYSFDTFYDRCLDVGAAVTEYTCVNGLVYSENLMCDYGEECIQTRSGGHCVDLVHEWSPGDTVWEGTGSASVIGNAPQISNIDLSDYGIETGGTCRLGVQFQTSWSYANNKCTGIPGMQGVKWDFYDSNGLAYSRVDSAPVSLGVDLHPETHVLEWDPQTLWVASMQPFPFPFPECSITYEWSMRIYIYDGC